MKKTKNYSKGSPEYVYYNGLMKVQKGKNPSACLSIEFGGFKDPNVAFNVAQLLLSDTENTLLGKPFLRSEINYAEYYQKHLIGPDKDIPFSPISGIDKCICADCFYRHGPNNPENDCQMASTKPKIFFGFSQEIIMPPIIAGKDLGHYCSFWLNSSAK